MAIRAFGYQSQERMALEEMSELTNALMKRHRNRASDDDVVTEIADVMIMMEQLRQYYGKERVDKEIQRKLERLTRERLNGNFADTSAAKE